MGKFQKMQLALILMASSAHGDLKNTCFRAALAAHICCTQLDCENKELTENYNQLLEGNAAAFAATSAQSGSQNVQHGVRDLAGLAQKSSAFQRHFADLCLDKVTVCESQCKLASKSARVSHDAAGESNMNNNLDACGRDRNAGNALKNQAAQMGTVSSDTGNVDSASSSSP